MALRGFRDMGACALGAFAGAAERASQRVLSSEAARCPDWVYVAVGPAKAFVRGAMYAEMQEQGGDRA
eukprot:3935977-Pyramimonas_sp.AAC.1